VPTDGVRATLCILHVLVDNEIASAVPTK